MRFPYRLFVAPILALVGGACIYPELHFVEPSPDVRVEEDSAPVDSDAPDTSEPIPDVVAEAANDAADASDARDAADTKDAAPTLRTWLFDFGLTSAPTPGYNNVNEAYAGGGTLTSLVDSTGATTTLSLRVDSIDCFHTTGGNGNGTTMPPSSLGFASTATRDTLYGSTLLWMGEIHLRATVEFLGLDPSLAYDLEVYASRMSGTGVLESAYAVRGVTAPTTQYLNANDNVANKVSFTKVRPTSTGSISMTASAGPKNTSPYGYFYVGALRLTAVLP